MLEELLDLFIVIILLPIALAAAMFGLGAIWAVTAGPATCAAYGEHMKLPTTYSFWNGCFVTLPDGKVLKQETVEKIFTNEYRIQLDGNKK